MVEFLSSRRPASDHQPKMPRQHAERRDQHPLRLRRWHGPSAPALAHGPFAHRHLQPNDVPGAGTCRAVVPKAIMTDPRKPIPGTRLLREWDGAEHSVTVLRDGFDWQGRKFKSLSAVARAITGTQWNGYRFFGLREAGRDPR